MKILHICSISNNKTSGISNIVPEHFINQKQYAEVSILNCNSTIIEKLENHDNVFYLNEYKKISILPFVPDIVVFHSFYIPEFIRISKELIKLKIPYIIIPHGSLTLEAQKQKKIKKQIANFLFFNNFINNSAAIQYLSESEKKQSEKFLKNSLILGNGIDIPKVQKKEFNNDKLKMLYIGRYSIYTKGLDLIFQLVNDNLDFFYKNNITIDLYGAGADGITKVKKMLDEKNSNIIKIYGPVFGKEKENVLLSHDVFIQLSRHEGQPLGIMEAMAYGLPILVSRGTTFDKIASKNNCGIEYKDHNSDILKKIDNTFLNRNNLKKSSINCIEMVKKCFSWDVVSNKTVDEYKKIWRGK